jgi:hypothetical protein
MLFDDIIMGEKYQKKISQKSTYMYFPKLFQRWERVIFRIYRTRDRQQ